LAVVSGIKRRRSRGGTTTGITMTSPRLEKRSKRKKVAFFGKVKVSSGFIYEHI
jgi:hypothetical protein